MEIHAILHEAYSALNAANNQEEKLEAKLLLQRVLNVNQAWLISHQNEILSPDTQGRFEALLQRRIAGEPIAYILGEREFYGLTLRVTPDTLIPRADTETLVDAALEKISNDDNYSVLDLGTGTGAIALAIAKHRAACEITAIDASEKALKIAQENAQNLNINNVGFLNSDWFEGLKDQHFDVIVSNPPYIEAQDPHLAQGDLRFEPQPALASGQDGLDAIKKIIKNAPDYLQPNGWLLLEHGYNQKTAVQYLLKAANFNAIETIKDLGGNDRVSIGRTNKAIR